MITVNMSKRISLFAVVLLIAVPILAQSHRASVRGVVLDPAAAPVPRVALQITNQNTGESRSAVTEIGRASCRERV